MKKIFIVLGAMCALIFSGCDLLGQYQGQSAQYWHDGYVDESQQISQLENQNNDLLTSEDSNANLQGTNADLQLKINSLNQQISNLEHTKQQIQYVQVPTPVNNYIPVSVPDTSGNADVSNQLDQIQQQNSTIQANQEAQLKYQKCLSDAKEFDEDPTIWCTAPSPN